MMWFDEQTKLAKQLRKLPSPQIPADLEKRLRCAIRKGQAPAEPVSQRRLGRATSRGYAGSLALPIGSALVAGIGIFAMWIALRSDEQGQTNIADVSPRYAQPLTRTQET